MAKKKPAEGATGTVQARHAAKAQLEATVNEERARIAAETLAAQKATAKFLASKPADSRGLER